MSKNIEARLLREGWGFLFSAIGRKPEGIGGRKGGEIPARFWTNNRVGARVKRDFPVKSATSRECARVGHIREKEKKAHLKKGVE